jgi:hypothetical protein
MSAKFLRKQMQIRFYQILDKTKSLATLLRGWVWHRICKIRSIGVNLWHRHTNRADDRIALQLALFLTILGYIFDCFEPAIFPDADSVQAWGKRIFYFYAISNSIVFFLVLILCPIAQAISTKCLTLGACVCCTGFADWIFLIWKRNPSPTPLAFHAAFGLFAAVVLGFSSSLRNLEETWKKVATSDRVRAFEIRKELQKELQWMTTLLTQATTVFVSIFGVAMGIVITHRAAMAELDSKAASSAASVIARDDPRVESSHKLIPTSRSVSVLYDSKTGQLCIGLGICLVLSFWWGVAPALTTGIKLRQRWSEGLQEEIKQLDHI